jgi:membrane protease YdiL (CAAX protease family)
METKKTRKIIWGKVIHFPLTRIIIGLVACAAAVKLGQAIFDKILNYISISHENKTLLSVSVVAIIVLSVYINLYRYYEKRKITELSTNKLAKYLATGVLLGFVLQSFTIGVIYLNKGLSVISVNSIAYVIPSLAMVTAAIFEEVIFRGVIFRITEEKLGSYTALAISALIFGAIHLVNPNSTLISGLAVAIEAGLLLGAAYIYTRNLWYPIAIHFAWNFTQSGIYGASTSGHAITKSLFTTRIGGSTMISGGQFGPEGSVQAMIFCLTATIILMVLNKRQNKIIKPYWVK